MNDRPLRRTIVSQTAVPTPAQVEVKAVKKIATMSSEEMMKKYDELNKKGVFLQQKRTELLTKYEYVKKSVEKIKLEIKEKYGINSIEEFEEWLQTQKAQQEEILIAYEENMNKLYQSFKEIEEKLK